MQAAGFAEGTASFPGVTNQCGDRLAVREYAADDLAANATSGADYCGGHGLSLRAKPRQHSRLPPCNQLVIAEIRIQASKAGSQHGCRPPTGTTVAQLPEPRPQTVTQEPEPTCPAFTGLARL